MVSRPTLAITVVYAPQARAVHEFALSLAAPCNVGDALLRAGLAQSALELATHALHVGVWGRKANWQQPLRDLDRVEVYRPLRVDPKVARRERFVKQGARTAGLFAKKRPGAGAGY